MIFNKWDTAGHDFPTQRPPSLLLMLINMFLSFGSKPEQSEVLYGDAVCDCQRASDLRWAYPFFSVGRQSNQRPERTCDHRSSLCAGLLSFAGMVSVIDRFLLQIMLLVKPLLLKKVHKRALLNHDSSHSHVLHNNQNDMIDEEFDEGSPLLARPNGTINASLPAPFCFNLCGSQGTPFSESHGDHEGEACHSFFFSITFLTGFYLSVLVWRGDGAPGHPHD